MAIGRWSRTTTLATLAVALGLGGGCRRGSAPTVPPDPSTAAPVSRAMLGGEGLDISGQHAFEALLDSPEVTAAGERILDRLGSDPSLEPLYAEFLESLMQQPALLDALMTLADQDPDASIESLSAQVGERLGEAIDGPAFDAALDRSLDLLLDRPRVDDAFERLADATVSHGFTDALAELVLRWQPDIEDAVGVAMTDESFEARFEAHLDQPGRAAALEELLVARIGEDPEIRSHFAALLDDEEVFVACAVLVTDVLSSDGFSAHSTDVFAGMIVGVDAEQLDLLVERALVTPQIEQAVVSWVERVMASPSFEALAIRFGRLLDDPNTQAELYDVLLGTPSRSAA